MQSRWLSRLPPAYQTLLTTQVPDGSYSGGNYETGTGILSDVPGRISAVRFWKPTGDIGTHVGRVWSAGGQLLASTTFSGETSSGWQQQALATPLPITANTEYIVSVNTANGLYVATNDAFAIEVVNGNLHAPPGANGRYGAPGTFPTASYRTNYFRDVIFIADEGADMTPPAVLITQPTEGVTARRYDHGLVDGI